MLDEVTSELLGPPHSLTVVTQDPRTDAGFLVRPAVGQDSVIISFVRGLPSTRGKPSEARIVDVSPEIFTPQFDLNQIKVQESTVALVLPDILVGAGRSADQIVEFVLRLVKENHRVIVTVAVSGALTDDTLGTGWEQKRLLTRLLYEARVVASVQPLPTGRAEDITGALVIRRGPRHNGTSNLYREFVYTINKNSVTLGLRS